MNYFDFYGILSNLISLKKKKVCVNTAVFQLSAVLKKLQYLYVCAFRLSRKSPVNLGKLMDL